MVVVSAGVVSATTGGIATGAAAGALAAGWECAPGEDGTAEMVVGGTEPATVSAPTVRATTAPSRKS
jgi:hypothetical protein